MKILFYVIFLTTSMQAALAVSFKKKLPRIPSSDETEFKYVLTKEEFESCKLEFVSATEKVQQDFLAKFSTDEISKMGDFEASKKSYIMFLEVLSAKCAVLAINGDYVTIKD